jgi:ABC-2 type transport system ATP-binding protein
MVDTQKPVVQAVGLTKTFRDFWHRQRVVAVDKLDLDIQPGEVFGLLGPNGSGKTTTIKMLLGLLYPTRGRIHVLGYPPTDVAVKAKIGYLPEESYLYRFLNARETLDYYGRLFKIPRQERHNRVEQLLEMVGLQREARRKVGEYSKGMARRIGLAQALINDPAFLILDEPTTGLDPIGTREIKDLILFLNREKRKTILLCSHLLADVEDVCRRVSVLYGGRRQALGDIHELLKQQNQTQITTERLTDEMVERIRDLVEREANSRVLEVTAPADRLESFFLRIVREAQQARQQTAGVTSGGQIAGFLAQGEGTDGEQVVDSLIAAGQRKDEPPPAETKTAPAEQTEDREVIQELVPTAPKSSSAQPDRPTQPESPATPAAPAPDENADRTVIDDLLNRSEDEKKPGDR